MAKKTAYRRRRFGFNTRKIPLAVIAGLAPGIVWSMSAGFQGNWTGAFQRLVAAYTGYETAYNKMTPHYLNYGLLPLLAGAFIHVLANWIGLNRTIGRALPITI